MPDEQAPRLASNLQAYCEVVFEPDDIVELRLLGNGMADFATLAVAAEEGLGLKPGTFLSAYAGNRGQASDLAIEASAIGEGILGLIDDRNFWEGTARELLAELENHHCSEQTKNRRDWPKNPQALGKALRRIAPNLRQTGIDVRFDRGKGRGRRRLIALEKSRILPSDMSELSESTRNKGASNVVSDMSDGSDSKIHPYSCESLSFSERGTTP
ncbi:MAG: hypothetical protein ACYS14_14680 [Planctomycetota bacterium]|jgi:hypothetical protein